MITFIIYICCVPVNPLQQKISTRNKNIIILKNNYLFIVIILVISGCFNKMWRKARLTNVHNMSRPLVEGTMLTVISRLWAIYVDVYGRVFPCLFKEDVK